LRYVVTYTLVWALVLATGLGCASKPKKGPSSSFSSKPANPRKDDEENKRNFNPVNPDNEERAELDKDRPDIFGEDQDLDDDRTGLGDIVDPGAGDGVGDVFFPSPSPGLEGIDVFPTGPRPSPVPGTGVVVRPTPTPTPGVVVRPPVTPPGGTLGLPFRSFSSNPRTGREVHGERSARRGRAIKGDSWTGTGSLSRRSRYVAE
jgi:hypothetical protein